MTMVKRSKKNVLLVLLLTCILSATLVALRVHITSATEEYHNISVECIFDVTYPRWNSSYNRTYGVHVKNNGTESENFTLTIYNSTGIIAEKDVTLSNGTQEIIKFTLNHSSVRGYPDDPIAAWDETGYFTHKVNASASTVEEEAITEDNYSNTTVSARWNGDVNCDGHVNQTDLGIIQDRMGCKFPAPCYNVSADLNLDGEIDIVDIVTCGFDNNNGPLDIHDVAVTDIFNVTYPTWNNNSYLTFGVAVKNVGWHYSETFHVTIYNGTNLIGNETVTNLASRAEKIVNFTLQGQQSLDGYPDNSSAAWPYPTHTIRANASEVDDELDTENNEHENVTVTVRWPGDVNGDGHVNQTDLDIIQDHVGEEFPDANYTASADLNLDGIIDIDDIVTCALERHNGPLDDCDIAVTVKNACVFGPTYPFEWPPLENPEEVYPGWDLEIYVTVENNGDYHHNFTLKAYANTTIIGTKFFGVNLAPGSNTTVHFTATIPSDFPDSPSSWSHPYPIYNIKVNAAPHCNRDDNLTDNEDPYDTVEVWCPGDTNGDGHLNDTDLSNLSGAIEFYNYYADFNDNNEIDLNDVQKLISDDRWKKGPED